MSDHGERPSHEFGWTCPTLQPCSLRLRLCLKVFWVVCMRTARQNMDKVEARPTMNPNISCVSMFPCSIPMASHNVAGVSVAFGLIEIPRQGQSRGAATHYQVHIAYPWVLPPLCNS